MALAWLQKTPCSWGFAGSSCNYVHPCRLTWSEPWVLGNSVPSELVRRLQQHLLSQHWCQAGENSFRNDILYWAGTVVSVISMPGAQISSGRLDVFFEPEDRNQSCKRSTIWAKSSRHSARINARHEQSRELREITSLDHWGLFFKGKRAGFTVGWRKVCQFSFNPFF